MFQLHKEAAGKHLESFLTAAMNLKIVGLAKDVYAIIATNFKNMTVWGARVKQTRLICVE